MSLFKTKEVKSFLKLNSLGFIGTFIVFIFFRVLKLDAVNEIYEKVKNLRGRDFFDKVYEELRTKIYIYDDDLNKIPKTGPFITVSNHPLGGMDGIALVDTISKVRPDYKVMVNFLLKRIEPLDDKFIAVNPFEDHKEAFSSLGGTKEFMSWIKEGNCVGVFPAGEVSTKNEKNQIDDREWQTSAIKLIKKCGVPVIPIYFHAKHPSFFYFFAKISETFRTALLPRVAIRKNKKIRIRIGKPITVKEQKEYSDTEEYKSFLRKRTYMLSRVFSDRKKVLDNLLSKINLRSSKTAAPIAASNAIEKLESEIQDLNKKDCLVLVTKNYELYLADQKDIPNILWEIGRQREITFREIGEGTNREIDLDKYDRYYQHLFLWDKDERKLCGAYRMGLGKDIYQKYGVQGFYIHELFNIEPEIQPFLSKAIEMGRAFVTPEYQQKPLPLYLLWKGIVHLMLKNPEYKFLIGGVSISNQFSDYSKSMMIQFMKSNYYDPVIGQYVRAKKEFKIKVDEAYKYILEEFSQSDINKFEKLINDLEPGSLRLPVLMKKYIKQNARVIAFNVDPKFNNAIDGLMYIRISDIPASTIQPILDEFEKQAELE